jgi:hypothetical protein
VCASASASAFQERTKKFDQPFFQPAEITSRIEKIDYMSDSREITEESLIPTLG